MSGRKGHIGLYYLVLRRCGQTCSAVPDCASFIAVLDAVLRRTGYELHAYCMFSAHMHLAVQMTDVPLADFVQRLSMAYQRWTWQQVGSELSLQLTATPRLVEGVEKARELVRFIHLLPLRIGKDPADYAWSGHRTYLGRAKVSCLSDRRGLRLFARQLGEQRRSYEAYILSGLQAMEPTRFSRSLEHAVRGAGGKRTWSEASAGRAGMSLEQLGEHVAALASTPATELGSGSRARLVSLLRALMAWHAVQLEMATLREVARYLHRDPSSIYSAIKRYRTLYPRLFERPGHFDDLPAVTVAYSKSSNERRPAAKVRSE